MCKRFKTKFMVDYVNCCFFWQKIIRLIGCMCINLHIRSAHAIVLLDSHEGIAVTSLGTLQTESTRKSLQNVINVKHLIWTCRWNLCYNSIHKTRSAGQSPTWGRPVPQVRMESQFRIEIPLTAMAAGEWLRKLYPRTTWRMDLCQLTVYEHFG